MTWQIISIFQKDFGNPPWDINLLNGGDTRTVEERKRLIEQSHDDGTHHSWYCGLNSCPTVAISHETDHALCRPEFCPIIKKQHNELGNHGVCSPHWCQDRYWMDIEHQKGLHDDSRCLPDSLSCKEVYESHQGDHKLCRPIFCDLIRKLHNGYDDDNKRIRKADHSSCNEYWCDFVKETKRKERVQQRHDAGDHSTCDSEIHFSSSCPVIREQHAGGNHDLCAGVYCRQKSIIDAHARGGHSEHCLIEKCPNFISDTLNKIHSTGKHDINFCDPETCSTMKKSHSTNHFKCSTAWCDHARKKIRLFQWLRLDPDEE